MPAHDSDQLNSGARKFPSIACAAGLPCFYGLKRCGYIRRFLVTLMARAKTFVSPFIITLVLFIGLSNGRDTLHLGVLVSQEGETDLSGFLPALDLALETIDNDTSLRYRFDVTINDSKASDLSLGSKASVM